MIIIQSEKMEHTTDEVMQWLFYLSPNTVVYRENGQAYCDTFTFQISNSCESYQISDKWGVGSSMRNPTFWYRRGNFRIGSKDISKHKLAGKLFPYFRKEGREMEQHLNKTLAQFTNHINNSLNNEVNKLTQYQYAKSLNISIPKTIITTNLSSVLKEFKSHGKVLAKDFLHNSYLTNYHEAKLKVSVKPTLLDISGPLDNFPDFFLPSLFQEYIEKKYEVRSFYLDGNFKSMIIFSQQNEKTKIDFRNYDRDRPNRCVPYYLPKEYEKKLHELMLKLEINCGSFDLIVTPDDQYYFLEVNPVGQFQWLSKNCNYFIERMVAKTLLGVKHKVC